MSARHPHRRAVIIDCDPGVDDAIALLAAFASPELELLAVTTVGGNVDAALTARNARIVRQLAGREDVPVHAGADRPLLREPVAASHFHGESGLGDLPLIEPAAPLADAPSAVAIVEAVMRRPAGSVSLALMGPMTNLALALRLEPTLAARLGPVVAMGGARSEGGNITASAEYNINADPHAGEAVARSGVALTMLGLDATHQLRATAERLAQVEALGTPRGRAAAELLAFSRRVQRREVGEDDAPLHDPCTVLWLLRPDLFTTKPCRLDVETGSALTLGHTAVEFRVGPDLPATADWVVGLEAEPLWALLLERLA